MTEEGDDRDRLGYIDITQEAVLAFLRDPGDEIAMTVIQDLPKDLKVHGVYYRPEAGSFRVIVQSPILEIVPEGGAAPMIYPVRETIEFVRSKSPVGRLISRTEFIARARHLVWIGYQIGVGQDYNRELNPDQMASLLDGVHYQDANPDNTPEQNHDNWMKAKIAQGWKYGPVKDFDLKEHPDLVPFADLPEVEQRKDVMDKEAHVCACELRAWLLEGSSSVNSV